MYECVCVLMDRCMAVHTHHAFEQLLKLPYLLFGLHLNIYDYIELGDDNWYIRKENLSRSTIILSSELCAKSDQMCKNCFYKYKIYYIMQIINSFYNAVSDDTLGCCTGVLFVSCILELSSWPVCVSQVWEVT